MRKGTFTEIKKRKNRDLSKHDVLPIRSSAGKKKISLSLLINKALWPTR